VVLVPPSAGSSNVNVMSYVPASGTWRELAPVPVAPPGTHTFADGTSIALDTSVETEAVVAGNALYLFESWSQDYPFGVATAMYGQGPMHPPLAGGIDIYKFDSANNRWSAVSLSSLQKSVTLPANQPSSASGLFWTGRGVLVTHYDPCGARSNDTGCFSSIASYAETWNPSTDGWSKASPAPMSPVNPQAWTGDALVVVNNSSYASQYFTAKGLRNGNPAPHSFYSLALMETSQQFPTPQPAVEPNQVLPFGAGLTSVASTSGSGLTGTNNPMLSIPASKSLPLPDTNGIGSAMAFDPQADTWYSLPQAPQYVSGGDAFWAGDRVVLWGDDGGWVLAR
jgi:hypothetical protein